MPNKKINICSECGSEYFKLKSKMQALCPECAHILSSSSKKLPASIGGG